MQAHEVTRHQGNKVEAVRAGPSVAPRVDIFENGHEILLLAELPGVRAEGLRIDVDKDRLTLEARRSDGARPGTELSVEYRPVEFRRSFLVPQGIDRSKIDAELKAGVLRLRLPKADTLKPRTIPVRSA